MTVKPQTEYDIGYSKDQWKEAFNDLKKRHDLEWGAFFKAYKTQFNLTDTQVAKDFALSLNTVNIKINLFEDWKDAERIGLEDKMPTKASVNSALKGTVQEKVETLETVSKIVDKPIHKVTASDIRKNNDFIKNENINKNYNSNKEKEIEIEAEPVVDYEALYKETKEELKKTKAILKKRNAEIKKLKERLAQYEAFDLREFGYESNTALDAAKTFADMLNVMYLKLSSYMDKCRRIKNDKFNHGYMNHLSELKGQNPWAILGLPQTADLAEVKKRYRQLVKKLHPDFVEGKENEFNNVTIAYNIVKDHLT